MPRTECLHRGLPYLPRTPYNAAKAGGDHVVRAYGLTYDIPITITNCSNNYGPRQFPEKVIPLFTTRALAGEPLPLYASTKNRREWLHVSDHASAIDRVIHHGRAGETYNVGSGVEVDIEGIADTVLGALGLGPELKTIVPDRPSPRPPLPARLHQAAHRARLGPRGRVERRDRRHRRLVPRERGLVAAPARALPRRRGRRRRLDRRHPLARPAAPRDGASGTLARMEAARVPFAPGRGAGVGRGQRGTSSETSARNCIDR